jgi:hypothetical protein
MIFANERPMNLMLPHLSTKIIRKRLLLFTAYLPAGFLCILYMILSWGFEGSGVIKAYIDSHYSSLCGILLLELPILYYCAVECRETRWLSFTFWLSTGLLVIIALPRICLFILGNLLKPSIFWKVFLVIDSIAIFLGLILLRYRLVLRSRNNIFQYKNSLKIREYRQAYVQINRAANLKELNAIFSQLQMEYPFINKFLKLKYKKKKAHFENQPLRNTV